MLPVKMKISELFTVNNDIQKNKFLKTFSKISF